MYSAQCVAMIKKFEGLRLTAYDDGTGTWTIGYGHTSGVTQGMTITESQAEAFLNQDLPVYNNAVLAYNDRYHWTQNQEDALTSFAFNLGTGSIAQVTAYGSRDKETIAEKMLLYVNAGGQVMPGLVSRRQEEVALFRTASDTDVSTPDSGGSEPGSPYFPKYIEWNWRIDRIFQAIGADKYYTSASDYTKRTPIANANGIENYTNTSAQNRLLAALAEAGQLKKPN